MIAAMMVPANFILAEAVVVPEIAGVTTAIVAFIFVCVVFPHIVKNKTQFYAAFTAVLLIILLHSLNVMIGSAGFQVFSGAATGLLQVVAIVMLFLSAGGITLKELTGEMSRAYEVIRRGEEEKTVIVPLTGEQPRPREPHGQASAFDPDESPAVEKLDLPPNAGWPKKPDESRGGDSSIPLE